MAAGAIISPQVQYDYPELFTPYPKSWAEKRREKVQDVWRRIDEMRAFHDLQEPPGWQLRKVDSWVAECRKDIARWKAYRAGRGRGGHQKARGYPQYRCQGGRDHT